MSEVQKTNNLRTELLRIAGSGKAAQAYLLESTDREMLLRAAEDFAQALGASRADTIYLQREKAGLISVDDIRTGVVQTAAVRPYDSPKKVYIIERADDMNVQAQNALLKTLEEPPEYVMILLLAKNAKTFLPTVLSRCVKLSDTSEADSGEGESAEVQEALRLVDEFFRGAPGLTTERELHYTAEIVKRKSAFGAVLERFLLWYRDILLCRMSGNPAGSRLSGEQAAVRYLSEKMPYEGINRCILLVQDTRRRLELNVNTEISFEVLFAALRRNMQR